MRMYNKNIVDWGEYEDKLLGDEPAVTLYMDNASWTKVGESLLVDYIHRSSQFS